jgi:hypothetical protein
MHARRVVLSLLFGVALCGWCGWASGFHRDTVAAVATWCASLVSVVVIDVLLWRGRQGGRPALHLVPAVRPWPRPGRGGSGRVLLGVSPWLALAAVVVAWEVLGIDTGAHQPHLTISALSQAFRPLDAALLVVWMLVGVGYGCARARAPVEGPMGEAAPGVSQGVLSTALVERHQALAPALLLPPSRAAGVAFWVGVVVVCGLVDLAARRSGGRLANAEEFVRLLSGPRPAKALLIVAWVYAGWHLFAH